MNTRLLSNPVLAATTCLLIAFGNAEARRINVPQDHETIQQAITASRDGDVVIVAPGTYRETVNFGGKAIVVASLIHTTGNRAYIDSTVIDGEDERPCVVFRSRETETSVLRGFTITNGRQSFGAGIDCQDRTRPQLLDLHITNNHASSAGGGIYCTRNARPLIERCLIDHNTADAMGGGGIGILSNSFPIIRNCKIINNSSPDDSDGGAVWILGGSASITNTEINGNTGFLAGGFFAEDADTITIQNSSIQHNVSSSDNGDYSGLAVFGTDNDRRVFVNLDHVLITDNVSKHFSIRFLDCFGSITNVTFTNNRSEHEIIGKIRNCELTITNSIFFDNEGIVEAGNSDEREISIDYCNIEGGADGFTGAQQWGDNNIDSDPLFVDPDNGDYNITQDSPCFDAGDPNSPLDPDGTRADMGALSQTVPGAWVYGRVFDSVSGVPIEGVILSDEHSVVMITDRRGLWSYQAELTIDSAEVSLTFSANGFLSHQFDSLVHRGDSIRLDVGLMHGTLAASFDFLDVRLDSGGFRNVELTLTNAGNIPLRWSSNVNINGVLGLPFGSLRDSLQASQIVDDARIEGVVFDGERFYLSGANDPGDVDDNLVYILDRDGALVDSFPQIGSNRFGYKDMDWDGENLWAVGEDSVYCMTTEGRVVRRWVNPMQNPTPYLAYDDRDEILWLAGTTTDFYSFDSDGNRLERTLDNLELKTYGLGFSSNDPDGYNLYIVNKPVNQEATTNVTKMNTMTGDTLFVFEMTDVEGSTGFVSAFVCNNFDEFFRPVLMTMQNISVNAGGDRLEVYQLYGMSEWLTIEPDSGAIDPTEAIALDLFFRTTALDSSWWLAPGLFESEIIITHDGIGGELILPVTMNVIDPDDVKEGEPSLPVTLELFSAYPNPFNSMTKITYGLDKSAPTRLLVYGIDGREVVDLFDGHPPLPPPASGGGKSSVLWNAEGLPGGIYFVRLEAGAEMKTMKVVLLK